MPFFVFAYGSLIFRPSRFMSERRPARIRGYRRTFRQASPDHRGTPESPGRVVTLIAEVGAHCEGALFTIRDELIEEALIELDDRESGGYHREQVLAEIPGEPHPLSAVTWIGAPTNPNHMPEAPLESVVRIILRARGKSGTNADYVLRLAAALREMGVIDEEVVLLERAILQSEQAIRSRQSEREPGQSRQ